MHGRRLAHIAATLALAAGCASLPVPQDSLEAQVGAVLERRGLGPDALLVIDNLLRHGPAAPRAAPGLVLELLARPLAAADASELFRRSVPGALTGFAQQASPVKTSFEELLQTYLAELAEAQRMLRGASKPFDEEALLRQLAEGLPSSAALLAVADALDTAQLERANLLFIEATSRFVTGLRQVRDSPSQPQTLQSVIGTVSIGTHANDRHGPGAALIVDPGGDDVYERAPARAGAVSVIVDLGGNDEYRGSDLALRGLSAIVDLSGNDRYAMDGPGLAAALAGAALLVDFSGNDSYEARFFAQGAAVFGIGALIDLGGEDRYRLEAWGQGFGAGQGLGLLWDRGGKDRYAVAGVPDPFNRGAGLSGAQGAAFGYRGRLGGGIGILRDDGGDDLYEAQMFAQGLGYYYGLGLLWDRGGNDRYHAVRYAQGNGVHQALGVLRDEAGDDRYEIAAIYGQGMGLDVAVGMLVDLAGDDAYRAHAVAQGAATANGFGLLADASGADRFELGPDEHAWGRAEWLRGLPSVGVLLHGNAVEFSRDSKPVAPGDSIRLGGPLGGAPVAVQAPTADSCPAPDAGEALLCRLRDASALEVATIWDELEKLLAADPATPLAGWIAIALGRRPPPQAQAGEIAALLARRESCNVRARALRSWPTLAAAQAGLRSGCFRLQAAAREAFARLGVPLPADAALASFLRGIPPQEDTY
jgi:hypothetical protein